MRPIRLCAVLSSVALAAACGGATVTGQQAELPVASQDTASDHGTDVRHGSYGASEDHADMSEADGWYGAPAPPEEAGRTIHVTVDDDLRFSPDTYAVAAGEVVTFVVTNVGRAEHEFVIGDEAAQQTMSTEMDAGSDHGHTGR